MFTQDHGRDLDALLGETEPLCLVRFGDGEIALIDGNPHRSADAWRVAGPSWLRGDLIASLRHDDSRWCIGLPTPCCLRSGLRIHPAVRVPVPQRTFATIFLHANLHRIQSVLERFHDAIVVGSWFGDVRVPEDGVSRQWDVNACVDEIVKSGRDVLLAAGPCSNIIAMRYWQRVPAQDRHFVIDVGSALDVHHGRVTRHFHDTMRDHECSWQTVRPATRRSKTTVAAEQRLEPQRITEPSSPAPQPDFHERGRHQGEPMSRHTRIGRRP